MTFIKSALLGLLTLLAVKTTSAQNLLAIPDTLSGTNFNLTLLDTSKEFYPAVATNTFGVNANYLGPTLIMNRGDSVNISVNNQLMDTTTIHWHGMHVSALNDGGPHIVIPPGTTWNPQFKVRDHAASYWYHPHLHMMTNLHATLGAAGMIIVRDSIEGALNLPRSYGIDDFPLVIQSKCFDSQKQILIDNAYDSVMMVNGTINAYLPVPAQVVRFRVLNASSERVYNLGLQGNQTFYQITTDGGLLDAPVALTRLMLAPGERAEILVDFSGMIGQTINLMSYATEFSNAIYGAAQPGMGAGQVIPGYTSNLLNGVNFNIMSFNVIAPTVAPVTTIPTALITNTPWPVVSANAFKTLTLTPVNMGPTAIQGPFLINNSSFDMNVVNYSIPMDNIEIWTLTNQSPIAHPFHIHDVQFYITEINGAAPPPNMQGRKDVVLVPSTQTVKFIAKFETFCDSTGKYMYHCHMLPHEDDDMMGQFVVTCPTNVGIDEMDPNPDQLVVFPSPASEKLNVRLNSKKEISEINLYDHSGKLVYESRNNIGNEQVVDITGKNSGMYILQVTTPHHVIYQKVNIVK
jgi:bilirubin oxidase